MTRKKLLRDLMRDPPPLGAYESEYLDDVSQWSYENHQWMAKNRMAAHDREMAEGSNGG